MQSPKRKRQWWELPQPGDDDYGVSQISQTPNGPVTSGQPDTSVGVQGRPIPPPPINVAGASAENNMPNVQTLGGYPQAPVLGQRPDGLAPGLMGSGVTPSATRSRVAPGQPIGQQIETNAGPATFFDIKDNPQAQQAPPVGNPDDPEYQAAYDKYMAAMKRGPQKAGAASNILFQIAEGMVNFSRGMQGQQMNPYRDLGEVRNQAEDEKAAREFVPYEVQHQRKLQESEQKRKTAAADLDYRMKQLEVLQKQNPMLAKQVEAMIQKGQPIPKEIADQLPKVGLGAVVPGQDYRKQETFERGADTYQRPEGSTEEPKPISALHEKNKDLIERELPGTNQKFYTTGDKEADRIAQTSMNEAQLAMRAGDLNQREYDQFQTKLEGWQKDAQADTEKKTKFIGDATTYESEAAAKRAQAQTKSVRAKEIQDEKPSESRKLVDEADALEVEARKLDGQAKAARRNADAVKTRPAPVFKAKTVTPPKLSTGSQVPKTVTMSQIEQLHKKTGKSVKELKKMAQKDGYTIQ